MGKFRTSVQYKRIWNYVGAFFFASLVFFGGYIMIQEGNLKLEDLDNHTGIIIDKGVTNYKMTSAKGPVSKDVFFFKIKDLKQNLALYNILQDYTALDKSINKNDTVTVYFLKAHDPLKPNLDVFQLEKAGKVIESIESKQKESKLGYLLFAFGFIFIGMGIYQDKKHWKKDNNEK